jgi:hypothetical protein
MGHSSVLDEDDCLARGLAGGRVQESAPVDGANHTRMLKPNTRHDRLVSRGPHLLQPQRLCPSVRRLVEGGSVIDRALIHG